LYSRYLQRTAGLFVSKPRHQLSERAAPYRIPGHVYFSCHRHPPLLYVLRSHSKE
jgi:hypothetical protein